jgi:hypothetical protein
VGGVAALELILSQILITDMVGIRTIPHAIPANIITLTIGNIR